MNLAFLKNKWLWGGLAVGLGGLWYLGKPKSAPAGDDASVNGGYGINGVMPMFLSGGPGGMTSQGGSAPLPLGGETWQEPSVPLSENPDVRIAELYAGVQMAAINAAKETAINAAKETAINQPAQPKTPTMTTQAASGITTINALSGNTKGAARGVNAASAAAANLRANAQTPEQIAAAISATLQAAVNKNMQVVYGGVR